MKKVFTFGEIMADVPKLEVYKNTPANDPKIFETILNIVSEWGFEKDLDLISTTVLPNRGGVMFVFNEDESWEVENVERYWYFSSRNGKDFIETTYWVNTKSTLRKETKREIKSHYGDKYSLPDWAREITEHKKSLDNSIF